MAVAIALANVAPPVGAQSAPDPTRALAIIVNRANPVERLSSVDVRRAFLLQRQRWPDGRKVTVVLREEGQAERTEALTLICGMGEAEYARYVRQEIFRGNVNPPRTVRSTENMRLFVFNAPGAIGYVHADEINSTVRVVRVDGRLPGDVGYPLVVGRPSRARGGDWLFPRVFGLQRPGSGRP